MISFRGANLTFQTPSSLAFLNSSLTSYVASFLQANLSISNISVLVTSFQGEPLKATMLVIVPQFVGGPSFTAAQLAALFGAGMDFILPKSFYDDARTIPSLNLLSFANVQTYLPSPPPPSPPLPSPPPPFPPYNQTLKAYAIMANLTVFDQDFLTLSPEKLSEYESELCLNILVYLSASIGSKAGSINLLLGCIPLGSSPGSIVTKLVVTAASAEILAAIKPYMDEIIATPMTAFRGTTFASSFNVANASGVVISSPPPPPSPSPPRPPPLPSQSSPPSSGISPGVAGVAGVVIILFVAIVSVNAFLFIRARAIASKIKKDLIAPSLGPPKMDSKRFQLAQLPSIISAHHIGMPQPLATAPMRLLHIERVLEWPDGLKVFEKVDTSNDCLVIPYNQVTEGQWAKTMVLTWRWGKPKPSPDPIDNFSPMSDDQWSELLELMRIGLASGMELIWIGEWTKAMISPTVMLDSELPASCRLVVCPSIRWRSND